MDRKLRVFPDFAEADAADRAYYAALSPEERLALAFQLAQRHREANGESAAGLARVYRVVERERR
ncbi:MAG: hypothetical protein ACYTGZ_03190 [Planctomycetota bacterium]